METILTIDLGKSKSVFCKMDTIEFKPRFSTLATSPQKFHDVFAELDQQNSIVLFEVGAQSGWARPQFRQRNLIPHKPLARFAASGTFFASFPNKTTKSAISTSQSSKPPTSQNRN